MVKKIFLIFVLFMLIFTAGCSTCRPEGTLCCKGTVCVTPEVAMCDDGSTPEFKGCSKECVPQWVCNQ